jgi:hypothetical protein
MVVLMLCVCVDVAHAQDPHEGFRGIPWGASEAEVIAKATGEMIASNGLWVATWNRSNESAFADGFQMVPQTKVLTFRTKRGEKSVYYVSRDRLCMVVQTPGLDVVFNPDVLLQSLADQYDRGGTMTVKKDLLLPSEWGKLAGRSETLKVLEWANNQGFVRVAARTWPIDDYREAIRVMYASRRMQQENVEILEEIRRQKEEEERKRLEELARKKAEAERLAAEKAAAAAAAQQP